MSFTQIPTVNGPPPHRPLAKTTSARRPRAWAQQLQELIDGEPQDRNLRLVCSTYTDR